MKVVVLIFLLLLGFYSCSFEQKPQVILPKEKMTQLMSEVFVVEMYYQKKYAAPLVYHGALDSALDKTFQKHHVTSADYNRSFDFYSQDYEVFKEMNLEIIQRYNESLLKQ